MARKKFKGVLEVADSSRMSREELQAARNDGWLLPMAGGALEQNINALWVSKQTGKGSPANMATGTKKMRWVGGDINVARADGTEPYSDGTLFGDTVDFVNTINGNGAPVVMGQSGILAYLSWLACGQEVVTGGTNAVHTFAITGAPTGGQTTVQFNGFGGGTTTFVVPYNMTAAAFQAAMLAATNAAGQTLPAGSVTVTGGPLPATALTITFTGLLANQPVPLTAWTHTDAFTGGTTPAAAITQATAGSGYQHVATPNDAGGFYSTWVKSVGKSVVYMGQFNDARISAMRYEGSSASKVVKANPTLLILDPGQVIAVNPTTADDGTRPFIYTEGQGNFTIDNQVFRGHSAFALEAQWALSEWYGDAPTPFDVVNARATVALQGITIILDSQGLARWNQLIYNTPTPAVGAKPIQTIPALGSYSCLFNRVSPYTGGISESAKFEVPGVKWEPNLSIPANPAGGPVELPMAGEMRKVTGQPPWRVTVTTPNDVAYTV